jgi:hypothetical protein
MILEGMIEFGFRDDALSIVDYVDISIVVSGLDIRIQGHLHVILNYPMNPISSISIHKRAT